MTGGQTADLAGTGRDGSFGPKAVGTDASVTSKSSMVVRLLGELVATTQVGARIPSERDLARRLGRRTA